MTVTLAPAARVADVETASFPTICVPPTVVTVIVPAPLFTTTHVLPALSAVAFGNVTVNVLAVQSIK